MVLLIIRHGKAEPTAPSGLDADRRLLARGQRQARYLAQHAPVAWPVSSVVSSDAVRARDTAAEIGGSVQVPVAFDPRLRVDAPLGPVLALIAEQAARPGIKGLALVGHNPQLAGLISLLTLGPIAPSVELKTGQAVVLELSTEAAMDPQAMPGSAALRDVLRLSDDDPGQPAGTKPVH